MPSREKQIYVPPSPVPDQVSSVVGNLINAFGDARARAKTRANTQANTLQTDLAAINTSLPVNTRYDRVQARLLQFEQAYLTEREDWQGLVTQTNTQIVSTPDLAGTTIALTYHGTSVGTVYLNDARFVPSALPHGIQTYVLRDGTPREYVRVANDGVNHSYVKRYIVRGLSLLDMWNYYLGRDIQAAQPRAGGGAVCLANEHAPPGHGTRADRHPAPDIGTPLNLNQQIISHTRGWRKRFISAVPSEREIYSTRGAPFNGHSGVVKVDLVQVIAAGHTVRDVHSIPYANAIYGYQATDIVNAVDAETPPVATVAHPTGYEQQCFRGYRDVLRTREVLIDDVIPWAAMGAQPNPAGHHVLALGINTSGHSQTVEGHIQAAGHAGFQGQVRLNYSVHGAWFVYAVFDSAANAQTAYNFYGAAGPAGPASYGQPGWFTFRFYVPQLQPN